MSSAPAAATAVPSANSLVYAAKASIQFDKPICLDYFKDSMEGGVFIGLRDDGTKFLVKSEEEYTSNIEKAYKPDSEYILVTENSIYIVAGNLKTKKVV